MINLFNESVKKALIKEYAELFGRTKEDCEFLYLKLASESSTYGFTFFSVVVRCI